MSTISKTVRSEGAFRRAQSNLRNNFRSEALVDKFGAECICQEGRESMPVTAHNQSGP